MEVSLRYTLLTLLTWLTLFILLQLLTWLTLLAWCTFDLVYTADMVYIVDMVYTVDMVYSVDMVSLLLTLLTIFLQSKLLCTVSTYHTATTERNITAVAQDELPEHTPHTL